jgi:dihydrofolate synthase/folylpolyglutamate synthase
LPSFTVPEAAQAAGLRNAVWPARLQRLTEGPLAALLPGGWELHLDGGHNPAAGTVLGAHAKGWADRPLFLIVGMLDNRPVGEFLAPLAGQAAALRGVPIPGSHNGHPAEAVAAAARVLGLEAAAAEDVADALTGLAAAHRAGPPARVLICGSLYLAGDVLAQGNG